MRKLQLSLDTLKVESFTAGDQSETRGTVKARSNETWDGYTCEVWCYTSTCGGATWDAARTCAGDTRCAGTQ